MSIELYVDASVNGKTKNGAGAYAICQPGAHSPDYIKAMEFSGTSSTKAELQTITWALTDLITEGKYKKIIVYTDCLLTMAMQRKREQHFRKHDFYMENHRERCVVRDAFYDAEDKLQCTFIKLKAHKQKEDHTRNDRLFSLVDKESRRHMKQCNH